MLVTVITVCYNSEKTIRASIESVLNQTYSEIEYIVVDGKSKDRTVAIAEEYQDLFKEKGYQYRIISENDQGIYDAMNKGIRMANGEIIGMINSDDWYEPIAVEMVVKTYQETGFNIFYADINLIKENGQIAVKHSKLDKYPTSRHWNHPTTFITKDAYDEMGLYACQGIYDDFDLVLRFRKAGKKTVIKNIVLANFRIGGISNQKSFKICMQRCKDRYRCYRNNGYSRMYMFECVVMEFAKLILS